MGKDDAIRRGQRIIWRLTQIVFALACVGTVAIAISNRDLVAGLVMMAVNIVIGGIVFGVLRLVRAVTDDAAAPPPKP